METYPIFGYVYLGGSHHHTPFLFDYRVAADMSKMTAQQGLVNELISNGFPDKAIAFFTAFYECSTRYKGVNLRPDKTGRNRFCFKSTHIAEGIGGSSPRLYLRLKNVQNYVQFVKTMPDYIQAKLRDTNNQCDLCGKGEEGAKEPGCKYRINYSLDGESYSRCVGHRADFSFGELDENLIPMYWRLLELDYGLKKNT